MHWSDCIMQKINVAMETWLMLHEFLSLNTRKVTIIQVKIIWDWLQCQQQEHCGYVEDRHSHDKAECQACCNICTNESWEYQLEICVNACNVILYMTHVQNTQQLSFWAIGFQLSDLRTVAFPLHSHCLEWNHILTKFHPLIHWCSTQFPRFL